MNRGSLISLRMALNYAEEELGIQRLSELEKSFTTLRLNSLIILDTFPLK